jgi:RNA polymerase sigma-70 factor (ECF subfamily)
LVQAVDVHVAAVRNLEDARDRDLVRRVAEGDETAFRQLFQRYAAAAKGLAVRIVRQAFLAEEIVQEAFLALWRHPSSYREDLGSFRAWLMSTVHHRAVDLVRREEAQRRRAEDAQPDATDAGAGATADPAERVAEQDAVVDTRRRVRQALALIPPEQREVLELMYYGGKTQRTIARELDLPLGTVKSRALLGMRHLRTQLVGGMQ